MTNALILGGTGTLGTICAEFLKEFYNITIFSRNEYNQWKMKQKYPVFNYILGDICNYDDVINSMDGIDLVLHCAAMKHVSTAESQPEKAIDINIMGTENIINACLNISSIKSAIYFNTDKAIKPINTYGATKYLGFKLWKDANKRDGKFKTIILGNILNSTGSVLEIYKDLIKSGSRNLPVTHKDVERYFIRNKEIKNIFALNFASRKSVIIPCGLVRFKIVDLVKALGCKPIFTGLTQGEKRKEDFGFSVHEEPELLTVDEIKEYIKDCL